MDKKRNRFISAASVLPPRLFSILASVPESITDKAQEIILRVNRPLCVQTPEKRYYFTENNCVTDTILDSQMVVLSSREMFETFQNMCNYSVYSRQNEINSGFITLKAGHRAGICGSAVLVDKKITNIINGILNIFITIIKSAFEFKAIGGGVLGSVVIGIQRGIFSSEAGIGTGAIAAAATETNTTEEKLSQGYTQMLGVYITTFLICTSTALIL